MLSPARSHQIFLGYRRALVHGEVINVVRIMTATEPKLITITVDGELSREYVDAVETCAAEAIAQRRPTQLFLRDVYAFDESGLLARLAAKGVRLRAEGFTVPTSLQTLKKMPRE